MKITNCAILSIFAIFMVYNGYCNDNIDALNAVLKSQTEKEMFEQIDTIPNESLRKITEIYMQNIVDEAKAYREKIHLDGILTLDDAMLLENSETIKPIYYRGISYLKDLRKANFTDDFRTIISLAIAKTKKMLNNYKDIDQNVKDGFMNGANNLYPPMMNLVMERLELERELVYLEFLIIKCIYDKGSKEQCLAEINAYMSLLNKINEIPQQMKEVGGDLLKKIKKHYK